MGLVKATVGLTRYLLAAAFVFLAAAPASAACFEDVGCTDSQYMRAQDLRRLSCENLWMVRNTIFDENGLCFKTRRARSVFSNVDCWVEEQAAVALNDYEHSNVSKIVGIESSFGCN